MPQRRRLAEVVEEAGYVVVAGIDLIPEAAQVTRLQIAGYQSRFPRPGWADDQGRGMAPAREVQHIEQMVARVGGGEARAACLCQHPA